MKNPYLVPPFKADKKQAQKLYYWWSWHPCYPYWSKSCWGGTTIQEAWVAFRDARASSLHYYHNKLIQECGEEFIEIADVPCERLEVWQEIARDPNGWRRPHDAKPIKGWDK